MWYPSMSIFSHSCCPNTEALARTKYGLALSTNRAVKKDEELTIPYTSLWGSSVARKEDIVNNWYFQCSCDRCGSEDDWGSHLDTVRCQEQDCQGWMSPNNDNFWKCLECGHCIKREQVLEMEELIKDRVEVA